MESYVGEGEGWTELEEEEEGEEEEEEEEERCERGIKGGGLATARLSDSKPFLTFLKDLGC